MSADATSAGGTFIHTYDIWECNFELTLEAIKTVFGVGIETRKVPRDWHRCKPRGGSMRDRTMCSVPSLGKTARTFPDEGIHLENRPQKYASTRLIRYVDTELNLTSMRVLAGKVEL